MPKTKICVPEFPPGLAATVAGLKFGDGSEDPQEPSPENSEICAKSVVSFNNTPLKVIMQLVARRTHPATVAPSAPRTVSRPASERNSEKWSQPFRLAQ